MCSLLLLRSTASAATSSGVQYTAATVQCTVYLWSRCPSPPCCGPVRLSHSHHSSLFVLQRHWRGYQQRVEYKAAIVSVLHLQSLWRGRNARSRFDALRRARSALVVQRTWRMYRARRDLNQTRAAAMVLQCSWRVHTVSRPCEFETVFSSAPWTLSGQQACCHTAHDQSRPAGKRWDEMRL